MKIKWNTMETFVGKDGEEFLFFGVIDDVLNDPDPCICVGYFDSLAHSFWRDGSSKIRPTHWMSLPAPPHSAH